MSLKVSVKNKTTLVLEEEGHIGDEINLLDITNVDTREIEARIEDKKDEIYQRKLQEAKEKFELEKENAVDKATKALEKELDNLRKELEVSNKTKESDIKLKEAEIEKKYQDKINDLEKEIQKEKNAKEKELLELTNKNQEEIHKLNDEITALKNQKSLFGSKMTGENLEIYCTNLYTEASQTGFSNCKWYKDNTVVKDDDEEHGTKADFIFEIYATEECKEEDLLTNVCLEMKDENPDSTNKKKNEDFYKKLDSNRNKKKCKYALLVSNLELGSSNDVPIKKIREYPDMYMVRPGYMITFLNMLVSLTNKFKDLYLKDYKEKELIKNQTQIMDDFNELKKTYLDNPLSALENKVKEIMKSTEAITKANKNIQDECEGIIKNYINIIQNKLDKFEVGIQKSYKKNE